VITAARLGLTVFPIHERGGPTWLRAGFFHQQLANGVELVVDGGFDAMTICEVS
jgi:hypothetical protein